MAVDFSNMTPEQQQQFLVEQGRLREQIETEAKRQEAMRKVLQIARQRGYLDPRDVDNFGLDYDEVNSLFRAGQIKPISTPVPSQPPVYDGFGGIKARREAMESSVEPKQTSGSTGSAQTTAGGAQGTQTGNTGGAQAGGTGTGGGYASSGVAKGGTKTIGYEYDPNPGNVSLAYAMRNAPEQERRNALIDKWNRENGRSGGNTYASAGISRGGVVSPATMMRTSGVQPVQAAYGNNAPMGEGFDYTRTYDPMSNSMRPNDSYSYYDPSRNALSGGDGTDLTLTYDPMTGQMVRRRR